MEDAAVQSGASGATVSGVADAFSTTCQAREARRRAHWLPDIKRGACGVPGCAAEDCAVPYGRCHCGCGGTTGIAAESVRRRNIVFGEPYRYLPGHQLYGLKGPLRYGRDGGQPLQRARTDRGWSRAELGRRCDLTHSIICNLERGKPSALKLATAERIAHQLGEPIESLFTEERPETSAIAPPIAPVDRKAECLERAAALATELKEEGLLDVDGVARAILKGTGEWFKLSEHTAKSYIDRGWIPAARTSVAGVRQSFFDPVAVASFIEYWTATVERRLAAHQALHQNPDHARNFILGRDDDDRRPPPTGPTVSAWNGRINLIRVRDAGRSKKGQARALEVAMSAVDIFDAHPNAVRSDPPSARRLILGKLIASYVGESALRRADGALREARDPEYQRGREQIMRALRTAREKELSDRRDVLDFLLPKGRATSVDRSTDVGPVGPRM